MEKPRKLRVGILFGGKSAEHEVSLQSAQNVVQALDKTKFEPVLIGIDKAGAWHVAPAQASLAQAAAALSSPQQTAAALLPGANAQQLVTVQERPAFAGLDVVFPVLHGTMGEDGSVQGLLELANLPYVGPGILGSAVGMDKDVMKRLLRDAGISIADFMTITSAEINAIHVKDIVGKFGLPLFVKPANMGSSVGVSKVATAEDLEPAVREALRFDTKALIEKAIVGDEIECAVLGNDTPKASAIGRIIPREGDFYSYEAKYIDENGAALEIPAKIPKDVAEKAQATALKTYKALACEGMARVDMFAQADGTIVVNEINTIPGFTKISMYPKLWEISGLPYTALITELIRLAIERFERRQRLQTSYENHL